MKVQVSIPYQSSLQYEDGHLEVVGPKSLLNQISELSQKHGANPGVWPLFVKAQEANEILINEFIHKTKGDVFVYNHDELCHCRMVKTETVKNAVKAGCRSVAEVSRTTLAGTGCGSCRKDIEDVITTLTT